MDAPELTTLLLSMQSTLRNDIDRCRRELSEQHQRAHERIQSQLAEVVAQQKIANGRTSTNERAIEALKLRLRRVTSRSAVLGQYTKKAKAALAGLGVMVAGGIAEGIHQALPKLFELWKAAR